MRCVASSLMLPSAGTCCNEVIDPDGRRMQIATGARYRDFRRSYSGYSVLYRALRGRRRRRPATMCPPRRGRWRPWPSGHDACGSIALNTVSRICCSEVIVYRRSVTNADRSDSGERSSYNNFGFFTSPTLILYHMPYGAVMSGIFWYLKKD